MAVADFGCSDTSEATLGPEHIVYPKCSVQIGQDEIKKKMSVTAFTHMFQVHPIGFLKDKGTPYSKPYKSISVTALLVCSPSQTT